MQYRYWIDHPLAVEALKNIVFHSLEFLFEFQTITMSQAMDMSGGGVGAVGQQMVQAVRIVVAGSYPCRWRMVRGQEP